MAINKIEGFSHITELELCSNAYYHILSKQTDAARTMRSDASANNAKICYERYSKQLKELRSRIDYLEGQI